MAAAGNVPKEDVIVTVKSFDVTTKYSFTTDLSESAIKTAFATLNNVNETDITVSAGRRLDTDFLTRRLNTVFAAGSAIAVTVSTTSASEVAAIATKAADDSGISAAITTAASLPG